MYQNLLRLYTIICLWAIRLQLWAQEEGRDDLIWKGCTYLILAFAAFMYFYMR